MLSYNVVARDCSGDTPMFGSDLTDTQECIVRTADRNPDMTPKQIASQCDCSTSYVRETLNEHRGGFGLDL